MNKAQHILEIFKPRVFYRGTTPGSTQRIRTGHSFWDSLLFVSSEERLAKAYGSTIETITAKPGAKILYEGTREFISLQKGIQGDPRNYTAYLEEVTKRAKNAGYDAVWFRQQGNVGTAVINVNAFTRGN
jgi:hypothetical protein